MNHVNDISSIKVLSKQQKVQVTSNRAINEIVFHPSEPVMYVRMDGKGWNKVRLTVEE